jgi:hypothetical protein
MHAWMVIILCTNSNRQFGLYRRQVGAAGQQVIINVVRVTAAIAAVLDEVFLRMEIMCLDRVNFFL